MTYSLPAFSHLLQTLGLAGLFSAMITLSACNQTPAPIKSSDKVSSSGNENATAGQSSGQAQSDSKVSAALQMTNDYNGYTEPGTTEIIYFTISHAYPDGILTVTVIPPSENVTLVSAPQAEVRTLAADQPEHYMMQVTPTGETTQPINIRASVVLPDGQSLRRSFSVNINSSAAEKQKKPKKKTGMIMPGGTTAKQPPPDSRSNDIEIKDMQGMQEEIKKHD